MATTLSPTPRMETLCPLPTYPDWFKLPSGLTTPQAPNAFTQPHQLQPWTLTPRLVFES